MSWMKWILLSAAGLVLAASCANPAATDAPAEPAFEGTSQYWIIGSAIAYTDSMGLNVTVLDTKDSYNTITSATVSVDGQTVPVSGSTYYVSVPGVWSGGSKHTFKIKTPDGQSFTGVVAMPSGTLSGLTYSPGKGTLASSYTVSPPASGNWPSGAYISGTVTIPAGNYGYSRQPTGTSAVVFDEAKFAQATSVSFTSCINETLTVTGYQNGSKFEVRGVSTSW